MPVQPATPERLAMVAELAALEQAAARERDLVRAGLIAMLDRLEPRMLAAVNGQGRLSKRARARAGHELEALRRARRLLLASAERPGPGPRTGGGG